MANLDKDIHQKEMAIRFCLVNDMIPFPEVDIQNFRELSTTSTIITDMDVLGVKIDSTGRPRRVLFDCKTLGKTSPINRAFWAGGLMTFSGCDEAFIILRKKASEAHRLSAKQIKVHLFDETQFQNYANSCSLDFSIDYCYSTSIENWTKLYDITLNEPALAKFSAFLHSEAPIEKDAVKALRKFLSALSKIKGELDPAKDKHKSLFLYSLSIFAFLMAQVIHDLRNIVEFDAEEKQFESILKFYIWGGRDSYTLRSRLTELFTAQREGAAPQDPELKDWSGFMELTRKLLNSPTDIQKCILPLRELALMKISTKEAHKDEYISQAIQSNKRIRQFSMNMSRYLVESLKIPREFSVHLEEDFNDLRSSA
ncbi:hypothetical protein KMS_R19990 [Pseudomonas sp. LRP2-20]|uniref:hypothetical protein n=1 Tax=Pseudomonas sp. LRP2-20 TaxID=2944234 RepID=UPI0021892EF2|nr:hypothetical protein [Pseudomonas sp. LRP2-20]BDM22241.1 hypothetical protein KMS_R19990 [Pseudomonas sp. LRP2-20]